MKLLLAYLKQYKWIVILALVLASVNIGFSLLDPYITGLIVDRFIERKDALNRSEFVWGVLGLVGLGVAAAMGSTIASDIAGKKSMENTIAEKVAEEVANYMKKED